MLEDFLLSVSRITYVHLRTYRTWKTPIWSIRILTSDIDMYVEEMSIYVRIYGTSLNFIYKVGTPTFCKRRMSQE